jgi:Leucine-rich repeat (LRR) protein
VFGISLSCGIKDSLPIPTPWLSESKCNPVYLQQMYVQTYQNKSWTKDGYRLIFRNFVPYFQREIDVASWWNRVNVSEIHINNVYGLFEFDMGPMMFLSHLTNVTITGSAMQYLYNSMFKRLKCFENDQPRQVFIERAHHPFKFTFEQKAWDRLVYLDLHDNDLRYLDFNIFQNMHKLEYLFLHDNPKLKKFNSAHTLLTLVNVEQFTYDKFIACDFHKKDE